MIKLFICCFVLLTSVLTLRNQQDIVTSDSLSQSHGQTTLSGNANALSMSQSQANNHKVVTATFNDYDSLSQYDDYTPLVGAATFVDQIYTQDQLNAMANLPNQEGTVAFDQSNQFVSGYDVSGDSIINPSIKGSCIPMNWRSTGIQANDIGVGGQGEVFVAGIDGHLYSYNFIDNDWTKVYGDFDLGSVTRVDVGADGTPYVVTASGSSYYLNNRNEWTKLTGCATDIAVGRGGEIYKIGCDIRTNGFGIYRLYNHEESEMEKKRCKCLNQGGYCPDCSSYFDNGNGSSVNKEKYWFKLSGSGVKIAVGPNGLPFVINASGIIMTYENNQWKSILTGGMARDITISNDSELFYIDNSHNMFRVIDRQGSVFQLCGVAKALTAGPFSQPFIVGIEGIVYTTSRPML